MRAFLFIISVVLCFAMSAQEGQFHGRVLDAIDGRPMEGATIERTPQMDGVLADGYGYFQFPWDELQSWTLELRYIGYETVRRRVRPLEMLVGDTMTFYLRPRSFVLDTLSIGSGELPLVTYGSEQHSVSDYLFTEDGLLLLTYPKTLNRGAELRWLDKAGKLLQMEVLPKSWKVEALLKDYTAKAYLVGDYHLWAIEGKYEELRFVKTSKQSFQDEVEPILDTTDGRWVISTWYPRFPAFDYYQFIIEDSTYAHVHRVADEHMLELCRAEYKYLAPRDKLYFRRMALDTGMEKEVLACIASYEDGLYYEPLNAPMVVLDDTMHVFDHHVSLLYRYGPDRQLLDSVAIDYHGGAKLMGNPFTGELVVDEEEKEVYALYSVPGGRTWLTAIDRANGRTGRTHPLVHPYPERVKVRNGRVYYIYRPFESSQKKYLYEEGL